MTIKHHSAFDDIVQSLEINEDKIALIDRNDVEHTYGDFKQAITGTRAYLKTRGVTKGTKVLVFITMSFELYAVLEALFSLGAITIFLDPWMKGRKMGKIIKDVQPDLIILNKKAAKYSWLLPSTWFLKRWKIKSLPRNADNWEIENVASDDTALITFTSGTAGKPKGANRTYGFIEAQANELKQRLIGDKNNRNIDYTNLPIVALAGFAIGNTVVIPRINLMRIDKAEPQVLMKRINLLGVNRLVVSPSLLKIILRGIDIEGNSSISEIVTGGAPLSSSLVKKCIEEYPTIFFESIYGSTEVEPITGAEMKEIYHTLKSPLKGVFVGEIDSNIAIRVIKPSSKNIEANEFENIQLKDGEPGEIVVSGNHVNTNYYNNLEAFNRYKIKDSKSVIWHRTGDIGYREDGRLYLVGRDNRIMNKDGKIIHPFPIELFIQNEFGFNDIGYHQDKLGQFILYIGSGDIGNAQLIKEKIIEVSYPIDKIDFWNKALPRDPRHRSKLLVEELN